MGPIMYMILDYQSKRIIKDLDNTALLVALRILSQMDHQSWDIVDITSGRNKFVTHNFVQAPNGYWKELDDVVERVL